MTRKSKMIWQVTLALIVIVCCVAGFLMGYADGQDHIEREIQEPFLMPEIYSPNYPAYVAYADEFRFWISTILFWLLITGICTVLTYKRRSFCVVIMLVGSLAALILDGFGFAAETWDHFSEDFYWTSNFGRFAQAAQPIGHIARFVFVFGFLIFIIRPEQSKNSG